MGDSPSYELAPCPVCGTGAAAITLSDREDIRAELEELWRFHLRRLRPGAPVHSLLDRVVFSQEPPLRLSLCGACGTVFRNPREDAEALVETYTGEEPDDEALERLYGAQRAAYAGQARRLTTVAGRSGSGLEVGSYVGGFLAAAAEGGWGFEGADVNLRAVEFARARGFPVHEGTIDDVPGGRTFDAVAFWNCFDQLPDPRAAAHAARRLLRPGGTLAVRVPNGAFYAAWRRRLHGGAAPLARALLSHANLLGFPYRHGFTPDSLERLLLTSGFEPVHLFEDTLVPTRDGWTRRWAALEERAVKAALRAMRPLSTTLPWFELYARAI